MSRQSVTVGLQLKHGELPLSVEGYNQAEWILADYGDFLVHILAKVTARILRLGTALAECQIS
ncbi:MAG: RsfS/YbeB/iojap family protein [Bryobacteraceae bacterium]